MKRVKKGEIYWSIRISGEIIAPSGYVETNTQVDSCNFSSGNYFHTQEEAETMARKLRAVLKGAAVIEMPSDEEMLKAKPTFPMEYDPWDAKNIREGFELCYEWLKEKIVK